MPRVSTNSFTERLGVSAVARICAQAGQVFRELVTADVGIDGFVEVVEAGAPTGFLIGVQIKSGPSYFSPDRATAHIPANADHLAYWGRCHFPVIGVAHLEGLGTYWGAITPACSTDRIINGPHRVQIRCAESRLTPEVLVGRVIPDCISLDLPRVTVQESTELLRIRLEAAPEERALVSTSHQTAWRVLMETALSITAPDEMVADAAYRLSWYFHSEPPEMKGVLKARLEGLDSVRIQKLIRAVSLMLERDSERGAELIADLLAYVPDLYESVAAVLDADTLPPSAYEAAFQIVEYVTQEVPTPLRDRHLGGGSGGG